MVYLMGLRDRRNEKHNFFLKDKKREKTFFQD